MLRELIWKDIRLSRLPLLTIVLSLVVVFALSAGLASQLPTDTSEGFRDQAATVLATGGRLFGMLSLGTLTILAANIVAIERELGPFSVLAYLPLSRSAILGSKLLVLAGTILFVGWICLGSATVAAAVAVDPEFFLVFTNRMPLGTEIIPAGAAMVSAALLLSIWTGSAAISVAVGLVAPLLVKIAVFLPLSYLYGPSISSGNVILYGIYIAFSVFSLGLSWRHFLGRETLSGI